MANKLVPIFTLLLALQPAGADEAKLRPGDRISIRFREIPGEEAASLSGDYRIDAKGLIKLPYLERFQVAELTQTACERLVEQRYQQGEIFSRLTVTVALPGERERPSRMVTVMGEVRRPGTIAYSDSLTPLRAVAAAGGFTEFADPRKSKLDREDELRQLDLSKADSADSKLKLLPGDLLIIRPRGLR